jgi:hypothetical protein
MLSFKISLNFSITPKVNFFLEESSWTETMYITTVIITEPQASVEHSAYLV